MSSYTLKIVFSGLCALLPTRNGLQVLLLDPLSLQSQCSDVPAHHATLATRLVNLVKGHYPHVSLGFQPTLDGDEEAVFDLSYQSVTLSPLDPGECFNQRTAWFRTTEMPKWFIPFHDEDVRWAIDGSKIVPDARINPKFLRPPHKGLSSLITLTQGQMKTSSIVRDDFGNVIDFLFNPNGKPEIPRQALANVVTVEIPFDWDGEGKAPVVFTLTDFCNAHEEKLELFPVPGDSEIVVNISNLPQMLPALHEGQHFHCYCELMMDPGDCCDNPVIPGGINASGLYCPMITLHQ